MTELDSIMVDVACATDDALRIRDVLAPLVRCAHETQEESTFVTVITAYDQLDILRDDLATIWHALLQLAKEAHRDG